jgi:hypothetical protein
MRRTSSDFKSGRRDLNFPENLDLMRGAASHSRGDQAQMLDSQLTHGFPVHNPLRIKGSFLDASRP